MRLIHQLLAVSDAYSAATGKSESRISGILFGEGRRLTGLREGRDMLSGNIERAMGWFSAHWPEGAEWPAAVARPAPPPETPPS